jgi:molybdate/tungstate transport system ATP-binding protein
MIRIEKLVCRVGQGKKTFTLGPLDLEVAPGEYFVLLGRTGSGKTMLLECLCGLNPLEQGAVFLEESSRSARDITHLAPRFRNIAYVPQDYALFPHLSVGRNIAFSLDGRSRRRFRRESVESTDSESLKVHQIAELLQISHLLSRSCRKLSGGEKQRTALARALMAEPHALLMDEPVSALDEVSRMRLLGLLKSVQRKTGLPTIHVCHDLTEMAMVADRVGVLEDGKLLQVGTPEELYHQPASLQVARFLRCENYLPVTELATAGGTGFRIRFAQGMELILPGEIVPEAVRKRPLSTLAIVRPEYLQILPDRLPEGSKRDRGRQDAAIPAAVEKVADLGATVSIRLRVLGKTLPEPGFEEEQCLTAEIGKAVYLDHPVQTGERVHFSIPFKFIHFVEIDERER